MTCIPYCMHESEVETANVNLLLIMSCQLPDRLVTSPLQLLVDLEVTLNGRNIWKPEKTIRCQPSFVSFDSSPLREQFLVKIISSLHQSVFIFSTLKFSDRKGPIARDSRSSNSCKQWRASAKIY